MFTLCIILGALLTAAIINSIRRDIGWAMALADSVELQDDLDMTRMDRDIAYFNMDLAREEADYIADVNHALCDRLQIAHAEIAALKVTIADMASQRKDERVEQVRMARSKRIEADDAARMLRDKVIGDIERGKGG